MSARILFVEDDRTLRETLAEALRREGYQVTTAADGIDGADLAFTRHFDLLILDWMLPGRDGAEILREVREQQLTVPVLLLTVRSDEKDKVDGLDLGADDYVTKPFALRELLARIKALLRRASLRIDASREVPGPFRLGAVEIDLAGFRVVRDGKEVPLSPTEAAMLRLLYQEAGKAVGRNRFLDEIWGEDAAVTHRTIDTHVLHLRHKIERDAGRPIHLLTVHGVGYRLVLESSSRTQRDASP